MRFVVVGSGAPPTRDFPGGSAAELYASIRRLLSLADETRVFVCHDYAPGGRGHAWETTVAEQRRSNIHIHDGVDEAAYVALRTARDRTLAMPALIIPSAQINAAGGRMPPPESNNVVYPRLPLDVL